MAGNINVNITATVTELVSAMQRGSLSVGTLEQALKDLKKQLSDSSGQDIPKFNQQIKAVEDALKQAKSAGLDPMPNAFSKMAEGANNAFSAVRKLAYILPGIGVAGIFSFAIDGAITLATKLIGLNKATDDEIKANKEFAKTLDDAAKAASKQAENVTTLVNALLSGTLNPGQRKTAIDELIKQNSDYFGSLKDEKGFVDDLTGAYDKYLANLTKIGTAKAIETEFTKLFDKKLQLELEIDPKFLTITNPEVQAQLGRLKQELTKLGGPVDIKQNQSLLDINDNLRKRIELQRQINDLEAGLRVAPSAEVEEAKRQIDAIGQRIKGLSEFQKSLGDFGIKEAVEKAKGPAKEAEDLFDKLTARQKGLLQFGVKISPDVDIVGDGVDNTVNAIDKRLSDVVKHTKLQPLILPAPPLTFEQKELLKEIEKIKAQLTQTLTSGIENIAEGFGNALSGGGFTSVIDSFAKTIGEGLKTVGRILIEASIKMEAVRKAAEALATANPILGVVAGIAAIAAGVLIENLAQQNIKSTKFATGGIVTGPTLGLVGEAGPEVIFPLEKLNQFIKGANTTNNVNVGGRLIVQGTDLVTVINRTNKNQGLV